VCTSKGALGPCPSLSLFLMGEYLAYPRPCHEELPHHTPKPMGPLVMDWSLQTWEPHQPVVFIS
jgi:hypothetical protein